LSAQDRDLVAQDEDLGVLGCLRSGQQSEPADELAEEQVEEFERHAGDDRGPHSPRRKPQVNAMDQVFGTYRRPRSTSSPRRSDSEQKSSVQHAARRPNATAP
jgi:negative regulator of sigma E activity